MLTNQVEKWFKRCKLLWQTGTAVFVPPVASSPLLKLDGSWCLFSGMVTTGSTKQRILYQVTSLFPTKMEICTPSIEKSQQHPSNLWAYRLTSPTPLLKRLTMLLLSVKNTQHKWTALSVIKPPVWMPSTHPLFYACFVLQNDCYPIYRTAME